MFSLANRLRPMKMSRLMKTKEQIVLYRSTGILRYSIDNSGYKLIVEIDKDITEYYRSLIPKWLEFRKQMYPPHISIVRRETPVIIEQWGRYDGEEVEFQYSPTIHFGEVYCWLDVFSKNLEQVRLGLGLPISSLYTRPPEGFAKCFHTTLGNKK